MAAKREPARISLTTTPFVKLVQGRFGEAAAYGYPDVPLPEAELGADWCAWLFFVDDHLEEGIDGSAQKWTDVTEAVRGVLERGVPTGPLADTPLIGALADLSHRFQACWCGPFLLDQRSVFT